MERTGTLEPQDKLRTKEVGKGKLKSENGTVRLRKKTRKRFADKYAKLL